MDLHLNFKPFRFPFILLLSFLFLLTSCGKDPIEEEEEEDKVEFAVDIGDSQIPYIVISTQGVILNEPKVPAIMKIYQQKNKVQELNIGIEYRGSTSFRISDKKSFGIETWDAAGNDVDVSIFGLPEEEDWILNGHVVNIGGQFIFDRTMLYNHFGYTLARDIGRYASNTKMVEIEINGEYLGVYVFMEKLKRDKNRIDISKLNPDENEGEDLTGGYILKIDKTTGGDLSITQPLEYFENNWDDDARYTADICFRSQYDIFGNVIDFPAFDGPYHDNQYLETYFLYEYPDADEITPQQKSYIQDYIQEFETALLQDEFSSATRTYTDYIDIESFVDYFLLNEVCRNIDAYRLSTYLHKDKNGKLNMGPIWDLNIGFDTGDRVPWDGWVMNYNNYVERDAWMVHFWWPRLMEDHLFRQAVKDRWNALRSNAMSTSSMHAIIDDAVSLLQNNGAVNRNYIKWDIGIPVDYMASIESLKSYLSQRTSWMDSEIASF
ncbi:MAG: hypothetical protein HKN68_22125 [Saprospiraceae bacterium]|nr:hypothetical protein [Saprospiraceae bacterium]